MSGTRCPGRTAASALSLAPVDLARRASRRILRSRSLTPSGASLVVSAPPHDGGVDRAEGDLVGRGDDGLEPGAAGLLDVVRGRTRVQGRAQDGLAGQVEVPAVFEDRTGDELADPLSPQAEALDEPVQRGGQHVLVRRLCVRTVGACERNTTATDDRDPARLWKCEGNQLDQLISTTPDP